MKVDQSPIPPELPSPAMHALVCRLELDEMKLQRARDADTIFVLMQQLSRITEKYEAAMGHVRAITSKP